KFIKKLQLQRLLSLESIKVLICPFDDIKKPNLHWKHFQNTSNSVTEHRNMRRNIYRTNRNFLEFLQLATIESINFCDEISKSLDSAKRQTALLLEQSDSLKSQ
ncbi:6992_t:CDS:2, partial [Gigaspora rosea]